MQPDPFAQLDELQKQLLAPRSTPLANPQLIMQPTPPPAQPGRQKLDGFAAPQPVKPPQLQAPAPAVPQPAPAMPTPAPQQRKKPGIRYKPGKSPNRKFGWGL